MRFKSFAHPAIVILLEGILFFALTLVGICVFAKNVRALTISIGDIYIYFILFTWACFSATLYPSFKDKGDTSGPLLTIGIGLIIAVGVFFLTWTVGFFTGLVCGSGFH
jgi:hypothetical protein